MSNSEQREVVILFMKPGRIKKRPLKLGKKACGFRRPSRSPMLAKGILTAMDIAYIGTDTENGVAVAPPSQKNQGPETESEARLNSNCFY